MTEERGSDKTNGAQSCLWIHFFNLFILKQKILQDRCLLTGRKTDGTFRCPIQFSYNLKAKGNNCYGTPPTLNKCGRIHRLSIMGIGPYANFFREKMATSD